jgi:hypothetical protein
VLQFDGVGGADNVPACVRLVSRTLENEWEPTKSTLYAISIYRVALRDVCNLPRNCE